MQISAQRSGFLFDICFISKKGDKLFSPILRDFTEISPWIIGFGLPTYQEDGNLGSVEDLSGENSWDRKQENKETVKSRGTFNEGV